MSKIRVGNDFYYAEKMINKTPQTHTYHLTWDVTKFEVISHKVDASGQMSVVFAPGQEVMWAARYRDPEQRFT